MLVTLITDSSYNSIVLPNKINGHFSLRSSIIDGVEVAVIEGDDDRWIMKTTKHFKLLDSQNNAVVRTYLEEHNSYSLIRDNGERLCVYVDPISDDLVSFTKYIFRNDAELRIGRNEKNDIVFANSLVSSNHAVLSYTSGKWFIFDSDSTNGTFVNNSRVKKTELNVGDVVFIISMKIIIGKGFIAINNPDNKVTINTPVAELLKPQKISVVEGELDSSATVDYFSISPRFKYDVETAKFKIDTPPQSPITAELPFLLVIASTLAMGCMSIVTLYNAINTKNYASMVMGGSMLLATVLMPTITKRYEKAQKRKNEELRQRKYRAYLDSIQLKIAEESKKQETILSDNNKSVSDYIEVISNQDDSLWNRTILHNDFLNIRLGLGDCDLDVDFQYSDRKFSLTDDNLQEELYAIGETKHRIANSPITLSLLENYIVGVYGDNNLRKSFADNIIFRIASYYSYEDVKFVFIIDNKDMEQYDYIRWLPHTWNDDKSIRFIATNHEEVKELSSYFDGVIADRHNFNEDDLASNLPYYILFQMSSELSANVSFFDKLVNLNANVNFSVVNIAVKYNELPRQCSAVIQLNDKNNAVLYRNSPKFDGPIKFVPDRFIGSIQSDLSKRLLNTFLRNADQQYLMPKTLTFLDMYGVGKIEHLNPYTRWKENDPTLSLAAPVGVDTAGKLFSIDLHEKYHGPHGLVAGMTGSGKSEFIITYILSMAINYHPDEVAFILIDYKGGGLAGAFVDEEKGIKLPHISGTITNLDGASINRSLISIQSELRRRQAIFNEARKVSNEGTIDIYKYQKLYRRGIVSEPIPHLFIISDEFAELKTQEPEFMAQLISAARIGRSLGVHLILATQKPSGVVDDQIWSNSRFRVCLKVQEKSDSMDMIKRPDAASLADTGRFYLQVGFNEFFSMGQSAWCGAPYVPSDKVVEKFDNSIRFIDTLGRTLTEVKPKDNSSNENNLKQVVSIVNYLSGIAADDNISVRQLWLDPIPENIYVNNLEDKYSYNYLPYFLNPVIGEYDDPYNQSQNLLTLPISSEGHAIIYGSTGSGTELYLETLCYSLIKHHDARELNLFILDLGSETLGAFAKAPQVADVMFSADEEKVINMFKMLRKEVQDRKKKFSEYGGNYASYISKSEDVPANIVVIINNFALFSELFENLDDEITFLSREAQKYGIYFVISATASNAVRYRLQQNFKQLIVLQMNDSSDYVGILGQTQGVCPSGYVGRGIVKLDKVYEFQTAKALDSEDIMVFYRAYSLELRGNSSVNAITIPVLPSVVKMESVISESSDLSTVPVGISKDDLQIEKIDMDSNVTTMVLSEDIEDMKSFACEFARVINSLGQKVYVIDPDDMLPEGSYELVNSDCDYDDFVMDVFNDLKERNNNYKNAGCDLSVLDTYDNRVYFIFGMESLANTLLDDSLDKLKVLIEKTASNYKVKYVVFDDVSSVSSYIHQGWYKKTVQNNNGIWIGNGLYSQYYLKLNRIVNNPDDVPNGFGYVINQGKEVLTKLLSSEKVGESDE